MIQNSGHYVLGQIELPYYWEPKSLYHLERSAAKPFKTIDLFGNCITNAKFWIVLCFWRTDSLAGTLCVLFISLLLFSVIFFLFSIHVFLSGSIWSPFCVFLEAALNGKSNPIFASNITSKCCQFLFGFCPRNK